jgi:FKBP-type peptidyl-prolyl cis-trans isomerase FkpA
MYTSVHVMNLRPLLRTVFALSVCFGAGCVASPSGPSHFGEFSTLDLVVGTGTQAGSTQRVIVHYTGWLHDETAPEGKGARFDTSRDGDPLSFIIGSSELIRGFSSGVSGMREGGLRRMTIPPSFGYGDSRFGQVPPNATLVFEVELLDVVE